MAPTQCVAHEAKNGLCMFGYHMGIANGDGYQSFETKTDINTLLTEGSTYNQTFKTRLDKRRADGSNRAGRRRRRDPAVLPRGGWNLVLVVDGGQRTVRPRSTI